MDKQRQVYVQNIGEYFLGDRKKLFGFNCRNIVAISKSKFSVRKDRQTWQSVKYQNKNRKEYQKYYTV